MRYHRLARLWRASPEGKQYGVFWVSLDVTDGNILFPTPDFCLLLIELFQSNRIEGQLVKCDFFMVNIRKL
jgi:hypothetical protein